MKDNEENLIFEFQKTGKISPELLTNNKGIVEFVIKRYYSGFKDCKDDLFQEGVLGLIKAFEKYSSDKKGGFFNYKKLWVRKNMQLFIAKFYNINKFNNLSTEQQSIHLGSSDRSEKLQSLFEFVNNCPKISEKEKNEILYAIENVKLGFLHSKTFFKLKNLILA